MKKNKSQGEKPKKTEIVILVLLSLTIIFAGITFIQRYMTPFEPMLFFSSIEFSISIIAIACLFILWAIVVKKKTPQNYVNLQTTPEKKNYNIPNPLTPMEKKEFTPPPSILLTKKYDLHPPNYFVPKQSAELKKIPNPLNGSFIPHQHRIPEQQPQGGTWRCDCGHLAFGKLCIYCGRTRR